LYSVTYLPPTAPELAASITKLGKHREIQCDFHWGIDHAAWAVLKHVYPLADIPVIELSIDLLEPPVVHVTIARDLAELRTQGVLILASGNIVHNLREIDFANIDAPAFDWAVEFDEHIKAALLARDNQTLVRYLDLGESARRSVPTTDHYLPLLYAAAMREPEDSLTWIYEGFQNASISMRSFMLRGA
jgi:4,5-DOPA dioxygenase extradiol